MKSMPAATASMVEMLVKEAFAEGGALASLEPEPARIVLVIRPDKAVPGGLAVSAVASGDVPAVDPTPSLEARITDWLMSGDTGVSSETICAIMSGRQGRYNRSQYNWPHDNSDLGRCIRLLDRIPEWRPHLGRMVEAFPFWKPLVDAWDELEALYRQEHPNHDGKGPMLYARMKQVEAEVEALARGPREEA